MTAGTRALGVGETFLEPAALPPPPTRHALFLIVIALAALVHFGTIYWGDLYSETEGQYAAAAREMLQNGEYLLPTSHLRFAPAGRSCWPQPRYNNPHGSAE